MRPPADRPPGPPAFEGAWRLVADVPPEAPGFEGLCRLVADALWKDGRKARSCRLRSAVTAGDLRSAEALCWNALEVVEVDPPDPLRGAAAELEWRAARRAELAFDRAVEQHDNIDLSHCRPSPGEMRLAYDRSRSRAHAPRTLFFFAGSSPGRDRRPVACRTTPRRGRHARRPRRRATRSCAASGDSGEGGEPGEHDDAVAPAGAPR